MVEDGEVRPEGCVYANANHVRIYLVICKLKGGIILWNKVRN
jgi:hypothetical protein